MCVFGVALDHSREVVDCFCVVVNHLVRFGPLVHVAYVTWVALYTPGKGPDSLFKLLHATVCQPDVVVDVCLIVDKRFVLEAGFQVFDTLFVILICEMRQAKTVQDKRVVRDL